DLGSESEDLADEPKLNGAWAPRPAPERGQAERQSDARGSWPHVSANLTEELAAEAAAAVEAALQQQGHLAPSAASEFEMAVAGMGFQGSKRAIHRPVFLCLARG
ncbi:unnamed protein product, partial [Prorocentrum cordatum]